MYNFFLDKVIIFTGISIAAYIVRDGRELFVLLLVLLFFGLMILKSYQEFLLIRHIKVKYPTFYKKYADKIGLKFWIANLKIELFDLEDDYITNYIKHPIEINLRAPKSSDSDTDRK